MASFEQGRASPPGEPQGEGGASPPGEPLGGANPLGEPLRLAEDGSPYPERLAGDGSPHPGRLAGDGSPYPGRLAEDGSPHPGRLAGDGSPHPVGSPHLLGEPSGGANPPGEPRELPTRRKLPHGLPPFPVQGSIVQFVTVNAAERVGKPFLAVAQKILAAARFYHEHGRWFLYLFLIMPDHLHMLSTFPSGNCKATCGAWKGFLRKTAGIRFQSDCFEHRIRNESELAEKWHYIRDNPVRKGLVGLPDEWPYWIAFDPVTGRQTGGATGGARRPAEPGRANPPGEPHGGASRPRRAAAARRDASPHPVGEPHHVRLGGTPRPTLGGSPGGLAPPLKRKEYEQVESFE